MKIKTDSEGTCPYCGSLNLDYFNQEEHNGDIVHEFRCLDCGTTGSEWYSVEYAETNYYEPEEE